MIFFQNYILMVLLKMKEIFLCDQNFFLLKSVTSRNSLDTLFGSFFFLIYIPLIYCMCLHWNKDLKDRFHLCFKTHYPTSSPQIIFFLAVFNSHRICGNKYQMKEGKKKGEGNSIVVIRLLWK